MSTPPALHDRRREAAAFDRLVQEGGDFNPFTERGWETLARRFAAVVPTSAAAGPLLDVGCGTGRSRQIYRRGAEPYVGIDLSLTSLQRARARTHCSDWLAADGCHLPFADASFSVVAFSSVLHHVPDRRAALEEALRVLRPGGWVFAFDPNLLHPAMALFRHPRSPFYRAAGVSPGEAPLRPATLRRDFGAAGLVSLGQRAQSAIPYRAVAPPLLDRLLGVYNVLDRWWEAVGLGRRLGTFVVTWGQRP